jgi:hypothetical protein
VITLPLLLTRMGLLVEVETARGSKPLKIEGTPLKACWRLKPPFKNRVGDSLLHFHVLLTWLRILLEIRSLDPYEFKIRSFPFLGSVRRIFSGSSLLIILNMKMN